VRLKYYSEKDKTAETVWRKTRGSKSYWRYDSQLSKLFRRHCEQRT